MIAENKQHQFIVFGVENEFVYTNHREERNTRKVIPLCLRFGTSPYHETPQWLLEAFDISKNNYRTFALSEIEVS